MAIFDPKIQKTLEKCRTYDDIEGPFWIISEEVGKFLNQKAKNIHATNILEVGTSIGYSAIHWAEAIRTNTKNNPKKGQLYTVESHKERSEIALQNFKESGLSEYITLVRNHAPEHIPLSDPRTGESLKGKIDILFLDCIKKYYLKCLEIAVPLLHEGSLIIADNVTSHADSMQDFIDYMDTHPDIDAQTFDMGTGLLIGKVKSLLK